MNGIHPPTPNNWMLQRKQRLPSPLKYNHTHQPLRKQVVYCFQSRVGEGKVHPSPPPYLGTSSILFYAHQCCWASYIGQKSPCSRGCCDPSLSPSLAYSALNSRKCGESTRHSCHPTTVLHKPEGLAAAIQLLLKHEALQGPPEGSQTI